MTTRATRALSAILGVGLIAALLTGCGGRSSSVTGPSGSGSGGGQSTAAVQGRVLTTQSGALQQEATVVVVLQAVLGIGVAEAQVSGGTPLEGATVVLVPSAGSTFTATTTTDANGNFVFTDVPPGTYTITVNGVPVTGTGLPVTVGAGDEGTIVGLVTTTGVNGTISVAVRDVGDILQNDAQLGHAMNIARASHRDLLEIVALREQGFGWGEIARMVRVHPSVIGLGRSNLSDGELEQGRAHVSNARANGKGKGGNAGGNGKGKGPKS